MSNLGGYQTSAFGFVPNIVESSSEFLVDGPIDMNGEPITNTGNIIMSSGCISNSSGPVIVCSDIILQGTTTAQSTLDVSNKTTTGSFESLGLATMASIDVTGSAIFQNSLDAQGAISNSLGSVTVDDAMVITGTLDAQGAISNSLGSVTVDDSMVVTGALDIQGGISNSLGNITFNDNLNITGNVTVSGNISKTGPDPVNIQDSLSVQNDINCNNLDIKGVLTSTTGDPHLEIDVPIKNPGSGPITLNDNVVINGTLDIGTSIVSSGLSCIMINDCIEFPDNEPVGTTNYLSLTTTNGVPTDAARDGSILYNKQNDELYLRKDGVWTIVQSGPDSIDSLSAVLGAGNTSGANNMVLQQNLDVQGSISNSIGNLNLNDSVTIQNNLTVNQSILLPDSQAVGTTNVLSLTGVSGVPTNLTVREGSLVWDKNGNNLYVFNGSAWEIVESGGVSVDTLSAVLGAGNTTGANDIVISSGQKISYSGDSVLIGSLADNITESCIVGEGCDSNGENRVCLVGYNCTGRLNDIIFGRNNHNDIAGNNAAYIFGDVNNITASNTYLNNIFGFGNTIEGTGTHAKNTLIGTNITITGSIDTQSNIMIGHSMQNFNGGGSVHLQTTRGLDSQNFYRSGSAAYGAETDSCAIGNKLFNVTGGIPQSLIRSVVIGNNINSSDPTNAQIETLTDVVSIGSNHRFDEPGGSVAYSNVVVLGNMNNIPVQTSNSFYVGTMRVTGAPANMRYESGFREIFVSVSDQRVKQNIRDLEEGEMNSESIYGLNFRSYEMRDGNCTCEKVDGIVNHTCRMIGLIAQEVQQVNPKFVDSSNEDMLGLEKDQILWALIEEVKKLRNELNLLKA